MISEEAYKVTVSEMDQIIEITVVNKFLTGKVQVRKVSSKDHDKLLSGAEFVLYLDVNGNKPMIRTYTRTATSEADTGVYEIGDLKTGGYLLHERKPPTALQRMTAISISGSKKMVKPVIVERNRRGLYQ